MITASHDQDSPTRQPVRTAPHGAPPALDRHVEENLRLIVQLKSLAQVRSMLQKAQDELPLWHQRLAQEAVKLQLTGTLEEDPGFAFLINRLLAHAPHMETHLHHIVQAVGWEPIFILSAPQRRRLHQFRSFTTLTPEITLNLVTALYRDLLRSPLSSARQHIDRCEEEIPFLRLHLQTLERTRLPLQESPRSMVGA